MSSSDAHSAIMPSYAIIVRFGVHYLNDMQRRAKREKFFSALNAEVFWRLARLFLQSFEWGPLGPCLGALVGGTGRPFMNQFPFHSLSIRRWSQGIKFLY